jgi:hypothetical protein
MRSDYDVQQLWRFVRAVFKLYLRDDIDIELCPRLCAAGLVLSWMKGDDEEAEKLKNGLMEEYKRNKLKKSAKKPFFGGANHE